MIGNLLWRPGSRAQAPFGYTSRSASAVAKGSSSTAAADKKLAQKNGVIQKYLERPMQINGYKFDLRVYVVVTSFDPLKIYLNAEGLVRLATDKYEKPTSNNMDCRTMHLTNYSVNKHAESYVKNLDGAKGVKHSAASLTT